MTLFLFKTTSLAQNGKIGWGRISERATFRHIGGNLLFQRIQTVETLLGAQAQSGAKQHMPMELFMKDNSQKASAMDRDQS